LDFSPWPGEEARLGRKRANGLLKLRGGCGVVPSNADLFARVSPPIAGGEATSA